MPILWPLKVPERGNAITQRKTLHIDNCVTIRQQPKHICFYFICRITQPGHYRFFSKPPKIPTQIKQYMPNFCTQKNPVIENFKPKKILRLSLSLGIPSTPLDLTTAFSYILGSISYAWCWTTLTMGLK